MAERRHNHRFCPACEAAENERTVLYAAIAALLRRGGHAHLGVIPRDELVSVHGLSIQIEMSDANGVVVTLGGKPGDPARVSDLKM